MKPKIQISLMLLSIVGIVGGIVMIELDGGVRNRAIYAPLAVVAILNLVSLALSIRGNPVR